MDRSLPSGTVTLVFTDIEGSTRLLDAVGGGYGALLADHHRLLREVWAVHGGVEVDTEGDSFFVAFTDAESAVGAACAAQHAMATHAWPGGQIVRVRIGVHTGVPEVQDGSYWGSDVHYAARLGAAAHGGQILTSETTRSLARAHVFEDLGAHALKDFPVPRSLFHVVHDGVGADAFPPPRSIERPRSNLPPPVSELLGRDVELATLVDRVRGGDRLITVVGPGGTGKTRLAIEVGHRVAADFDSAWFVALEEVSDADDVVGAVARTIGLPEIPGVSELERVLGHLRARRPVLLLDNAEHVIDAAPQIAKLAGAGDDVRIVVTSQAPLNVAAERVVRLAPLALPAPGETEPAALAAAPAVALLLQRAGDAGSTFTLTAENAADVARLCEQLEGMPLAIELAAARLEVMDAAQLCARLDQRIDALGTGRRDMPARQRGLRAVLDWTVGLLDPAARSLLIDLAAFADGFTHNLAEAAFGDRVDELGTLLDIGLVRRDSVGRFGLRPPVRRYLAELASQEEDAAARTAVTVALAELGEPYAARSLLAEAEGRIALSPETLNITAAIDWADVHDHRLHARLCAAVGWSMALSNLATFGRAHLSRAVERAEDLRHRAGCVQAIGMYGFLDADPTRSVEAGDAWHELGEPTREALSLLFGAIMHGHRNEPAAARGLTERVAAAAAMAHDSELDLWVAATVAMYAWESDPAASAKELRRLLPTARPGSMAQFQIAAALIGVASDEQRFDEALGLIGTCLRVLAPLNVPMLQTLQLDAAASVLAASGRLDDAATALALGGMLHAELSWPPTPANRADLEATRAKLAQHLDDGQARAAALGIHDGLVWLSELVPRTA